MPVGHRKLRRWQQRDNVTELRRQQGEAMQLILEQEVAQEDERTLLASGVGRLPPGSRYHDYERMLRDVRKGARREKLAKVFRGERAEARARIQWMLAENARALADARERRARRVLTRWLNVVRRKALQDGFRSWCAAAQELEEEEEEGSSGDAEKEEEGGADLPTGGLHSANSASCQPRIPQDDG